MIPDLYREYIEFFFFLANDVIRKCSKSSRAATAALPFHSLIDDSWNGNNFQLSVEMEKNKSIYPLI